MVELATDQFKRLREENAEIKRELFNLKSNQFNLTNDMQLGEQWHNQAHPEASYLANQDAYLPFESVINTTKPAEVPKNSKQALPDKSSKPDYAEKMEGLMQLATKTTGDVLTEMNEFKPFSYAVIEHAKKCKSCFIGRLHKHFELYLCYLSSEHTDAKNKERSVKAIANKMQDLKAIAQAFRFTRNDVDADAVLPFESCFQVFKHCCKHRYTFENDDVQAIEFNRTYTSCQRISSAFTVFYRDMYNQILDLEPPKEAPQKKAAENAAQLEEYLALFKLMYTFKGYKDIASYGLLSVYLGYRPNTTRTLKEDKFVKKLGYEAIDENAKDKYLFCTTRESKQEHLIHRTLPLSVFSMVQKFLGSTKLSIVSYRTQLKKWLGQYDYPGKPKFHDMLIKDIRASNQMYFSQIETSVINQLNSTAVYFRHANRSSAAAYNKIVVIPYEYYQQLDSKAEAILAQWRQRPNPKTRLYIPFVQKKRGRPPKAPKNLSVSQLVSENLQAAPTKALESLPTLENLPTVPPPLFQIQRHQKRAQKAKQKELKRQQAYVRVAKKRIYNAQKAADELAFQQDDSELGESKKPAHIKSVAAFLDEFDESVLAKKDPDFDEIDSDLSDSKKLAPGKGVPVKASAKKAALLDNIDLNEIDSDSGCRKKLAPRGFTKKDPKNVFAEKASKKSVLAKKDPHLDKIDSKLGDSKKPAPGKGVPAKKATLSDDSDLDKIEKLAHKKGAPTMAQKRPNQTGQIAKEQVDATGRSRSGRETRRDAEPAKGVDGITKRHNSLMPAPSTFLRTHLMPSKSKKTKLASSKAGESD